MTADKLEKELASLRNADGCTHESKRRIIKVLDTSVDLLEITTRGTFFIFDQYRGLLNMYERGKTNDFFESIWFIVRDFNMLVRWTTTRSEFQGNDRVKELVQGGSKDIERFYGMSTPEKVAD